jgi:hypothetical protein
MRWVRKKEPFMSRFSPHRDRMNTPLFDCQRPLRTD